MINKKADANEVLQAILSTIDEGIHAVNARGITIFYNHVAAKHDGLEDEEVLGKHLLNVFPSLSAETSTLLKVCQTGEPIYNQPQSYYNMRGILIDTVNTTLPIKVNHQLVGAVEIAKDFTRIKQLSEKLLDLQAKAKTATPSKKTAGSQSKANYQMTDILTNDAVFNQLKRQALKAAATSSPILIYGETGTGKELLVQSIHNASSRRMRPFIAQNCAAIPSSLLESILFGTAKGSYTGAVDRPGLFELAEGGTLFLDELNSMPLDVQAKLLRVLQNGEFRRVGGIKELTADVRMIAALNEPAERVLREKTLRTDLYYRLNVIHLRIPPLRERKDDIPLLMNHFIQKYNFHFGKLVTQASEEVKELFTKYDWPGNVRELEHAVESAMNMADGDVIRKEHLPYTMTESHFKICSNEENVIQPLRQALKDTEKALIQKALKETNGNIQQAARLLKIPRQTLQYKLIKLNL
ncbi:sigma-54 interaction domain-containing protein [Bacillus xiapuensis]|uniref:sigma-54 interaction domain-containing protein n=1 Tax=Bacillus xiapuensis TaxID=2014075 RepID=UPI000C24A300|nr:sigma 54-interacting transcriptional regulator [Bacillus xiapuensis]